MMGGPTGGLRERGSDTLTGHHETRKHLKLSFEQPLLQKLHLSCAVSKAIIPHPVGGHSNVQADAGSPITEL